jgi:hypothetical protein
MRKLLLVAFIFVLSPSGAFAQCSGQPGAGLLCSNPTASNTLPTWATQSAVLDRNFGAPSTQGTILNRGASLWSATATPSLGKNGGTGGSLIFNGATSGAVTISPQAAAGSPSLLFPNTSGTIPSTASLPIVLNAVTGVLTCPTCVTGTGGALVNGLTTTSGYTNTQILSSNGTVLSAYSVSGTGNVVLTISPTFTGAPAINLSSGALPTPQTGTVLQALNANSTITGFELDSFAASNNFSGVRADGTVASPTALVANDQIVSMNAFGYNGTSNVGPFAGVNCYAANSWSSTLHGTYCDVAVSANTSSSTLTESIRFENDGGITVPSTVTGGDKGVGTINSSGLHYVGGNAVASSATSPVVLNAATGAVSLQGVSGTVATGSGGTGSAFSATPTLGASGTLGSLTFGNATSGLVTLQTVTGALGTVTASLPANTGTIAETNLAQTFSANQTFTTQVIVQSTNASALVVGPNGATNPTLQVVANVSSQTDGLSIFGSASGAGAGINTISPATNSSTAYNAKGNGAISLGNVSTGGVFLAQGGGGVTMTAPITESSAAAGTCTNGWAENSSHQLILVACPGVATSIQVGVTTVTSGTSPDILYNNSGTLGNASITGPLQLSAGALSINGSLTAHSLLIGQGTAALTNTGAGTLGQFAASNGASADPSFASGPWTLLATLTASASATLSDTTHITASYNHYLIRFVNLLPATNSVNAELQVHSGGSFQATTYLNTTFGTSGSTTVGEQSSTTFLPLNHGNTVNNTGQGITGWVVFSNPSLTAVAKPFNGQSGYPTASAWGTAVISGIWNGTAAVDGFQVLMSSGNITSGYIELYGAL